MKRALAILIVLAAAACQPKPQPGPTYSCETACHRQAELRCEVSKPTAEGSTCVDICKNAESGLAFFRWDLACMTTAASCDSCADR